MITSFFVLGVMFVMIVLWLVIFGIVSYQATSCPKYVELTNWLACGATFILVIITILGIVAINITPDVKHVESATEYVEETVEVVDSCPTEVMIDAPVFVEPVERVETHHASEVASVPVGY